jgi:uroporphyrinogen decarboxylase
MVELFIEAGVSGLYPLERIAGTDPFMIREKYPDFLLLGGISKIEVSKGPDAIDAHLEKIPELIEKGGYIPFIDHRVPSDVTLANFIYYMKVKRDIIGGDLGQAQCDFTNAREEALKPPKPFEYKPQNVGPHL